MRQLAQGFAWQRGMPGSFLAQFGPRVELSQEQSCLQFGQAVVGAEFFLFESIGQARATTVNDRLQRFEAIQPVGHYETPFAGRHELALLKAEAAGVTGSS